MKLFFLTYLLVCLFALTVIAVAPQKAVIVTYPENTPDSVMDQAKDTIRKAGGMITHDYKLIRSATCALGHVEVLILLQRLCCQSVYQSSRNSHHSQHSISAVH